MNENEFDNEVELDVETDNQVEDSNEPDIEVIPDSEVEDTKAEKEEKSYKPWKNKPVEDNNARIPMDRFNEVNSRRKSAEDEVNRLKAELAKYNTPKESPKSVNDIKIEDYDDVDSYLKARDQAIIAEAEARYIAREQARAEQIHNERIKDNFEKNLKAANEANPEIIEAYQFLDSLASQYNIDPNVARELIEDDLGPEIIYEMVTDETRLQMLFNDPRKALKEIHRLGATLSRGEKKVESPKAPLKPMQKAPDTRSVPAKVASKGVVRKSVDDMSQSEYEAYVSKNGFKGI